MDFALSDEQTAIVDMARSFGEDAIAPHARAWEDAGTIPREFMTDAGKLGLCALFVSDDNGGTGLSRLDGTLVFEALARACPTISAYLSIHNMCGWMVERFGSDRMRDRYLAGLCSGEKIGAYCLTEPGSGSDSAALRTRAVKGNDGYRLTGTKAFISGGGLADVYVIMCRTGDDTPKGISTILVDDGAEGLSFGGLEDKMGWRAQPTRQVQMDACLAPLENLMGEEGEGFTYAMKGLDGGRLNIAAAALGAAQMALEKTLDYMGERKAFGRTIDQFQALRFRLADMETELQAARVFLRQAAWKLDTGAPDATKHCAMVKRFVTDVSFRVANEALQLHGGYGYLADYGIEKIVRDLRVHQILEGSNEVMRLIISRAMLNERDS